MHLTCPRRRGRRQTAASEPLESRVLLATFVVSNTNDGGAGSLRQAILSANQAAGKDEIHFNVPPAPVGVTAISPATPLPAITEAVIVDASTQPGYIDHPLVQLAGNRAGPTG